MASCIICCEDFNKSSRKPVACPGCEAVSCTACVGRYLLGSVNDPDCMSCHRPWNREFLSGVMTKAFITKELKSHREGVLLDREKALLPASQYMVANYKTAKKLEAEVSEQTKMISQLKRQLEDLRDDTLAKRDRLNRIKISGYARDVGETRSAAERREFIRACPAGGCRGFLSTAWKCGTCSIWVCPDCHEPKGMDKDAPHTCNPDNVATARLLAKDTKPCPKCAALIHKLEGCDQMFCVMCQTAFSWRTGQIVTGQIHNPHYYEWLRTRNGGEVPRNPRDVLCGGMPATWPLHRALIHKKTPSATMKYILNMHQIMVHIQEEELPRLFNGQFNPNDNADIRVKYLAGEIDEDALKRTLQMREKKREKHIALRQVYEMLTSAGGDTMHAVMAGTKTPEEIVQELTVLVDYANTCITSINMQYKSKVGLIHIELN